jgi:hypothetical protein
MERKKLDGSSFRGRKLISYFTKHVLLVAVVEQI